MHLSAEMDARCSPQELFAIVSDLSTYPRWLSIVARCERSDAEDAWLVELRGRLGPMSRSKRLRMVRTTFRPGKEVRFERSEDHGRAHSPWVMSARVEAIQDGSRLHMALHYGGALGGRVLRRMLEDEITRSRPRLQALAEGRSAT